MRKRFTVMVIICLLAALAVGQEDPARQKSIEQMRGVANAIRQCPEQMSSYQDKCTVHRNYVGPPANLEWDVLPSKTVRSPFQGIVEFVLPSRSQDSDQPNQSKQVHQHCMEYETAIATALTAQERAELAKEMAARGEGHYRYEFDVGSDAPELVKMLWVEKDKENNTITSAVTGAGIECWVRAARSIGNSKADATIQKQNGEH